MADQTYEHAMRQEARRLIAEHGELAEARCISGPPDYRIELLFADGHEEIITRHSGRVDITMMKFGYSGTGTDCFWAFLDEAGFYVPLEQLETMEGPEILRRGEETEQAVTEQEPQPPQPSVPSTEEMGLPLWVDVSHDPSLVDPLILEKLQKSMCFMVRDETGPIAALIVRASPDEFRAAVTAETPMSLHVHRYSAPTVDLYGVYPIVWDDPEQPFFKETWLVGADTVTGPRDPLSEGELSRLEALLAQEYTYFLLVDPSNHVVAARRVDYSPGTQEHFLSFLPKVRKARGVTISNTQFVSAAGEYMNSVSLAQIVAAGTRLRTADSATRVEERKPATPTKVKTKTPARPSCARRLLAGLCSLPAAAALVTFLFLTGATIFDYVRGMESEGIPLQTQLAILAALFAAFALFAGLSVFLTDRRKITIGLWAAFLVLGLVATGGIVNQLLGEETPRLELPAAAPVEIPIGRGSPTPVPTPGSPGADEIIAYNPGPAQNQEYASPQAALGAPDLVEQPCCSGMLQLGAGGSILLAFNDNAIYDGPGPDFQIFGESARDDFIIVEVSADGQGWRTYAKTDESPGPFDLADVGLEQAVFVRITDVQPGTSTGAELDAVEAIHNASPLEGGLPSDLPDATARADASLHQGPGPDYDAVGRVTEGMVLAITECAPDGTWVVVQTPTGDVGWCSVTQIGLNVSLSDYEVAETPATPAATAAPLTAQLTEAQTRGLTQVSISGQGLELIQVVLESLTAEPLQVIITPGTVFQAHTAGTQNMVVRQRQVAHLPSRGSRQSLTIPAACANMELGVPEESDEFSISTAPVPENLIKLLNLPGFLDEDFRVQQFAIWTITDNPPRGGYVGLGYFGVGSGPDDEEMQKIRALFQQAGIPADQYQALR